MVTILTAVMLERFEKALDTRNEKTGRFRPLAGRKEGPGQA